VIRVEFSDVFKGEFGGFEDVFLLVEHVDGQVLLGVAQKREGLCP
jgi:hypothetical protein